MNAYVWRTVNAAARYVCSYSGSDITGDGLSTNPFRSLTKAHTATHILTVNLTGASGGTGYTVNDVLTLATPSGGIAATVRVSTVNAGVVTAVVLTYRGVGYSVGVKTTTGGTGANCTINVATVSTTNCDIICRGLFSDDIVTGTHTNKIDADYYGAAVWDGQNLYNLYGFRHNNMIFLNSGSVPGYVGVGGAFNSNSVGNANVVYGLAGSPAFVDNCVLYWGVVGGSSQNFTVFSRIKPNASYLCSLGSLANAAGWSQNLTVYGIPKASMRKAITTTTGFFGPLHRYSLYSNCAIYLDQMGTFDRCMFAGDVTWWVGDTQFTPTGATDAAKLQSIVTQLAGMAGTAGLNKIALTNTGATESRFTSQVAADIFNNPTLQDFTLKNGSDAILDPTDTLYVNGVFTYFGAMKPALNVPIMEDSSGVPGTWDENTATGCLSVAAGNIIQIDEASPTALSQIYSKVIVINNRTMILDGIKSLMVPKLENNYYLEDRVMVDTTPIYELTSLAVGRYKVCAYPLTYEGNIYYVGDTVYVSGTGTSFTDFDGNTAYLLEIDDPNFYNPVHVRQTRAIYATVAVGGALQSGGVYLNYGNESITYRGRTIVTGESFMAENSVDSFSGTAGYLIGIVFDDTRVPAAEWIPALSFDDYFNGMNGASQVYDDESRPAGSGNPKSYAAPLLGTFAKQLLNYNYIQFKIMLREYDVV
jgi:hypothetical protein